MNARPILRCLLPLTLLVSCSSSDPVANSSPSPTTTISSPVAPPSATVSPSSAGTPSPTVTSPAPSARGCTAVVPTAVPFPATTAPDTETPVGGPLGLQVATAGPQPGYDRVVFTLAGSAGGQPGWDVKYVSAPTSDGSGNAVPVVGSAFLEVAIRDVGVPGDTGVPDPAVKQLNPVCTKVVKQVVLDTVFEGRYTAFIGVSVTRPFRVFRLANPARVVVDVRHS